MTALDPVAADEEIVVSCPADGSVVGAVPAMDHGEVLLRADRLRAAQPDWEGLGPKGRGRLLRAWGDWILDNEQRLSELAQLETGKCWNDAGLEALTAVQLLNHYAGHAADHLAPRSVRPHHLLASNRRLRVTARPYPLVGIITPWNSPIGVPMMDVAPALAAGAAVLSKPSEITPLTWVEVVRGWTEVGGPDVLASITGSGATGAAVVDLVDMVMFTGSTRTGRKVAAKAAQRLIPCALELGGKDPMLVLADADVDRAVAAATWGSMANAGQACISIERVYVDTSIHDEFVAKLTNAVKGLRQGMDAPGSFACELGAMATEEQVQLVDAHVVDAVERGATLLTGGRAADDGLFYEPTVLTDVDHTMRCMTDETFGPVIPVMRVSGDAEAVALANESRYGLSASVWSEDAARAERVARQLEVGTVDVNSALTHVFQFAAPMSGWKESGIGSRFGGPSAVLKYCRQKVVTTERFALGSEPQWYPYTPRKGRLMGRVLRLLSASDWRRRVGLQGTNTDTPSTDSSATNPKTG